MKEYKEYIAVDFDATLSNYLRPWNYNKFGKPIKEVIKLVNYLYDKGYYIYIYTGRLENRELYKWLKDNGVKYHTINTNPKHHPYGSRFKPYMTLGIDDKFMNPMKQNGKYKSFEELKEEAENVLKLSNRGKD